MDLMTFLVNVFSLAIRFKFSVTSWIRTKEHNAKVGGHSKSWHMLGMGLDVVLDDNSDQNRADLKEAASKIGIQVINEGDHLHLEPKI